MSSNSLENLKRDGTKRMNILIIANRTNAKTVDALFQLCAYFDAQGIEHTELDVTDLPDAAFPYQDDPDLSFLGGNTHFDLIVTLGGDGTILHSSRIAYVLHTPILGAKFGHLGFLANPVDEGIIALVAEALADEIPREQRMNLHVKVICEGDDEAAPERPRDFFALNEAAIARGTAGHIVEFDYMISGDKVAHMRGDGLVVATATGSTAYALSAGGPLIGPQHRGMVAVPLAPHTLLSRAIVTEHHDVVEMSFAEGSASAHEVCVFIDGNAIEFERPISSVLISVGEHPTILLGHHKESFVQQIARTFFN